MNEAESLFYVFKIIMTEGLLHIKKKKEFDEMFVKSLTRYLAPASPL